MCYLVIAKNVVLLQSVSCKIVYKCPVITMFRYVSVQLVHEVNNLA